MQDMHNNKFYALQYLTRNHGANPPREIVELEWLGDHFHALFQKTVRHRDALGVAGDEKDLQAGPGFPRLIRELAAVDAGQADVGDQEIDPLSGSPDAQPRRSIDGFECPVTLLAKHLQDYPAHHRLVLDHQHGLAGRSMSGGPDR